MRAVLFSHVADVTPLEKFLLFTLNIQLTDDILLPSLLVHPFMDGNDLGKSEDGSIPGAI